MLISFRIKNFKSVVDTTVDLRYGEGKAPNGYQIAERLPFLSADDKGTRAVPVLAIYGQNASGKSTLCDALTDFVLYVGGNASEYIPNKLHPELTNSGIGYEIVFISNGNRYRYALTRAAHSILHEELECNGEQVFRRCDAEVAATALCSSDYPEERIRRIIDVECKGARGPLPLLHVLGSRYTALNEPVAAAYEYLTDKLSLYHACTMDKAISNNYTYLRKMQRWDEMGIFEEISKYIRMLDIDIQGIKKRKKQVWGDQSDSHVREILTRCKLDVELVTTHRDVSGNEVELNLEDESDGTIVLFELLGQIIETLKTGGVMIADEIDRSLHPILLCRITDFFTSRRYNANNAQLIFTAHNMEPLDGNLLRASEVGIVTKSIKNGSVIRRICDFEGVRNVKNFRRGYIEGMFSGIPFPYL